MCYCAVVSVSLLAVIRIAVLLISMLFVFGSLLALDATAAAEREKAKRQVAQQPTQGSRAGTPTTTPKKKKTSAASSRGIGSPLMSGASTPVRRPLGTEKLDQQLLDFAGLNLQVEEPQIVEEIPKVTLAREKLLEEVAKALQTGVDDGKKGVNLVVIGNVCQPSQVSLQCLLTAQRFRSRRCWKVDVNGEDALRTRQSRRERTSGERTSER